MLIGVGNALTDILVKIPDDKILDNLGVERGGMYLIDHDQHQKMMEEIESLPLVLAAGGSAANAMAGAAGLGSPAKYIGHIGNDPTGEAFRNNQIHHRVHPLLGISDATQSGKCISLVLPDGERTMLTYLGAALELTTENLTPDNLSDCSAMFIEGYLLNSPHVIEPAMKSARESGTRVALDAASFTVIEEFSTYAGQLIDEYVDILFANEDEARALTGHSDPGKALETLSSKCETVVVKVGADGSMIGQGDQRHRIGIIDAAPIDKTGAGDLYAAGFLYGWDKGLELKKCGDIGAVISSKSVEHMGAQIPQAIWPEIHRLVERIEAGEEIVR